MKLSQEDYLAHYGILRRSGRYPWGSGASQSQRNRDFIDYYDSLKSQGLSDVEIARGLGYYTEDNGVSTTALRAALSIAKNEQKAARVAQAVSLKERGYSNIAIGEKMGINESSVRSLLKAHEQGKVNRVQTTADVLRDQCDTRGFIQVGTGIEQYMGVSSTMLNNSLALLKEEGYWVDNIQIQQQGTSGKTTVKVLAPPGTTYKDVVANSHKIVLPNSYVKDDFDVQIMHPPMSISSKRIGVAYKEDGGADADGVIYIRPGVEDVSIGASRYAQVRVAVDGTHYLKGMAIYKDDLPPGVDIVFNTNKSNTGNKLDAMKEMALENDNPFGSSIRRQITKIVDGKEVLTSSMNIINEEGNWETWSKQLSSQFLSKQNNRLASQQLGASYAMRKAEFDEIASLTNPTVRKKLMEDFADSADSASVHLKAASLPKTQNHVLIPVPSRDRDPNGLKDTEVYAPNYTHGERVVLIRHPHGGTFEIPELVVNNRNPVADRLLSGAKDAIGITPKVAERLSGADFDGDHVLVIPNSKAGVKTSPALKQLEGFDPKQYKMDPSMPKMSRQTKGREMGEISNLITDMTIKGADHAELARAVKHSMVVIDAEKHHLNYKQSAIDNNIRQLKERYQGGPRAGASTVISQAKSRLYVPHRTGRPAREGGPIDKETGEKKWVYTDPSLRKRPIRTTKLAEAKDAHDLSSGTDIERIYADHSNRLKALANEARKEAVNTKHIPYSDSARLVYKDEVSRLDHALNLAKANRPLERQAQILADHAVKQRRAANPHMDDDELKKVRGQELTKARIRTGADRKQIVISDREWEAVQAGALSKHKLEEILRNADPEVVRQHATPRSSVAMTPAKMAKAKALIATGHTQADIAQILGVGLTTLKTGLREG